MMRLATRRARRLLWSVAALGSAVAGASWFLPVRLPAPLASAGTVDGAGDLPAPVVADSAVAEEIALASIFLPGRTPPATRYQPAESGPGAPGGVVMESNAMLPAGPVDGGLMGDVPLLLGTLVDDVAGRALLLLDPERGPRLYVAGDRDGGFRVVSVAPGAVVVAGPGGRVTLRLDPQEDRP